jgi:hypothetical protein
MGRRTRAKSIPSISIASSVESSSRVTDQPQPSLPAELVMLQTAPLEPPNLLLPKLSPTPGLSRSSCHAPRLAVLARQTPGRRLNGYAAWIPDGYTFRQNRGDPSGQHPNPITQRGL